MRPFLNQHEAHAFIVVYGTAAVCGPFSVLVTGNCRVTLFAESSWSDWRWRYAEDYARRLECAA